MHFRIVSPVEKCYTIVIPFFYVVIPIGIISWAFYKLCQTIQQHKSEINSSGHKRDLGLNVREVKITKSLFAALIGFALCWGPVVVINLLGACT